MTLLDKQAEPAKAGQDAAPAKAEQAADVPHVYQAVREVIRGIGAIRKTRVNEFDKYRFRGIDDFYNAIQPELIKAGIFLVPRVRDAKTSSCTSSQGKPMVHAELLMEWAIISAVDGSSLVLGPMAGEAMDRGDKATNKAMSAALKYALIHLTCSPTEEDNDTENHSPRIGDLSARQAGGRPTGQRRRERALGGNGNGNGNAPAPENQIDEDREKFIAEARHMAGFNLSEAECGDLYRQVVRHTGVRNKREAAQWMREHATIGVVENGAGEIIEARLEFKDEESH